MAVGRSAGEARAWGWVAHLRAGGTEPWHTWDGAPGVPDADLHVLPGAQQLEVLRRLNQLGATDPVLVDRVLRQSAPGRGQPDLELVGADRGSRFGPRPVQPAELPASELLRVAASLLAQDVAAAGLPPQPRPPRRRPWARDYRLLGDPELTRAAAAALSASGRPPRPRSGVVLVLLDDLGSTLAGVWTDRCFGGGVRGWEHWLRGFERRDELPWQVEPRRIRARMRESGQRGELHVVLDPSALPALTGTRRTLPVPERPAGHVAELARWVGTFLVMIVPPGEAPALLRSTLRPRIMVDTGPRLAVPPGSLPWVRRQAESLAADVERAGYPVHGDLERLMPTAHRGAPAGAVRREAALDLALRTLHEPDGASAGPER